jgi:hypothetical protein
MEPQTLENPTAAVVSIVMMSAAGLLSSGVQAENLHLSDRIRALISLRGVAGGATSPSWPATSPSCTGS